MLKQVSSYLISAIVGAAFAVSALTQASAAEVTIKAVTAWPAGFWATDSFIRFTEKVNEAGKGIIQINVVGGPEVAKVAEQMPGLRSGVFDMLYGSSSHHRGLLPEVDAFAGSTLLPWELRESGGMALLDSIYEEKIGVHLLSNTDTGWKFILYLSEDPKRTAAGGIDLSGLKMRSNPLYRDFLSNLGATNIIVDVPEIFSSFERGIVHGIAFPELGIRDLGLQKFLKHRVYPSFYQSDIVITMNHGTWDSLSTEAQDLLTKLAIENERETWEKWSAAVTAEADLLESEGVKALRLENAGAAEYMGKAINIPWSRLAASGSSNVEALRAKFVK